MTKMCSSFLKYTCILYMMTSINNQIYSKDIDFSFLLILKQFEEYGKNYLEGDQVLSNLRNFYKMNILKLPNLVNNIEITNIYYSYFLFYFYFINYLFISQVKLMEIIFNLDNNWNIRYKSMKIIEKIIVFEEKKNIFKVKDFFNKAHYF